MRTNTWLSIAGVALATLAIHTSAALSAPPPFPGANGQPFQALQSQINANIANFQAQIDSINTQIASLQFDVVGNSLAIATLQAMAVALHNEINILNATKQNNITGSCLPQWSIRAVLPNGAVVCEFDDGEERTAILGTAISIPPSDGGTATASCPAGWFATGGGHFVTGPVYINSDVPAGPAGWSVRVINPNAFSVGLQVTVICALSQ